MKLRVLSPSKQDHFYLKNNSDVNTVENVISEIQASGNKSPISLAYPSGYNMNDFQIPLEKTLVQILGENMECIFDPNAEEQYDPKNPSMGLFSLTSDLLSEKDVLKRSSTTPLTKMTTDAPFQSSSLLHTSPGKITSLHMSPGKRIKMSETPQLIVDLNDSTDEEEPSANQAKLTRQNMQKRSNEKLRQVNQSRSKYHKSKGDLIQEGLILGGGGGKIRSLKSRSTIPKRTPDHSIRSHEMFNESKVIFSKNIIIDPNYHTQQMLSHLKPNIYISEASLKITNNLIQKGSDNSNFSITLRNIIKDFIKIITFTILNRVVFSYDELERAVYGLTDEKKREAIRICIMTGRLLTTTQSYITIKWVDIMKWVTNMAYMIEDETIRISLKQIKSRPNDREAILNKSKQLLKNLENKLSDEHGRLLVMFQKISEISDFFLYFLFGINIKKDQDNITYTDAIVKSIFLTWMKKGVFPTTIGQPKDLPCVFWSLPFAYCTKLNGFGAIPEPEIFEEESPCSIEDFYNEAIKFDDGD